MPRPPDDGRLRSRVDRDWRSFSPAACSRTGRRGRGLAAQPGRLAALTVTDPELRSLEDFKVIWADPEHFLEQGLCCLGHRFIRVLPRKPPEVIPEWAVIENPLPRQVVEDVAGEKSVKSFHDVFEGLSGLLSRKDSVVIALVAEKREVS
jgi:hypothetical protein